jgi:maleylacetate reductase
MRGAGAGANLHAIVYEPELTLGLPVPVTVGTALNALAHAAEALYVRERSEESDRHALEGARLIAEWLPRVVERPDDLEARTALLHGACNAGAALGGSMLALGHALAQGLGGRYGAPHGALNALTLPAALRFNEPVAGEEIARFGEAIGSDDPAARVEELARLGGFVRLRDLGIPEDAPQEVAETVAARPGAKANPRPVTPADVEQILRELW